LERLYPAEDNPHCGLREEKEDEAYFIELEGVPECRRTSTFKVFTKKSQDKKYEVPVEIIKERTMAQREVGKKIGNMAKREILVAVELDSIGGYLSCLLKGFDVTVVGGSPTQETFMEIHAEL
jgi:hypothetical protein